MRFIVFLLLWTVMAGAASASSFAVLAPPKESVSASMVVVAPPVLSAAAKAELAVLEASAPDGIDPTVTLSYPGAVNQPPRVVAPEESTGEARRISASVIMLGTPAPERHAAVEEQLSRPFALPIVIRGGIAGDAFATPAAPQEQPAGPEATAGPGAGGSGGTAGAPPSGSKQPDGPSAPQPAQPPPAVAGPPTRTPD